MAKEPQDMKDAKQMITLYLSTTATWRKSRWNALWRILSPVIAQYPGILGSSQLIKLVKSSDQRIPPSVEKVIRDTGVFGD